MKTPEGLVAAVDSGIIQEVIRPLMSGKEAQVYVVVAGGSECVAKVYKEATQRTFKHRAEYTEGRRTRNSRDQRAVSKRTRHGRKQDENAWRSTEVDMIYRLRDAGVRVPEPINFVDGVLVMELVKDAEGHPAPRLGDLDFAASEAQEIYGKLIREVVRMLCAGVVHGDLSDFNVLMGVDGPVVIDFPQAVDPAHNQNARKLLLRDVENLHRFVERFSPDLRRQALAQEMWSLYESNRLKPTTKLRGDYRPPAGKARTEEVLALIGDANFDERERRLARGIDKPVQSVDSSKDREPSERAKPAPGPPRLREVVDFTKNAKPKRSAKKRKSTKRAAGAKKSAARKTSEASKTGAAPKKRRPRRRRKSGSEARGESSGEAPASASQSPTQARTKAKAEKPAEGASAPKRRRRRGGRGRRSAADSKSAEAKAGKPSGAKRPAKNRRDTR